MMVEVGDIFLDYDEGLKAYTIISVENKLSDEKCRGLLFIYKVKTTRFKEVMKMIISVDELVNDFTLMKDYNKKDLFGKLFK